MIAVLIGGCASSDKATLGDCTDAATSCSDAHGGDTRWFCDTSQSPASCSEHPRACAGLADCCPAQTCSAGTCVDLFTECAGTDGGPGPCAVPGQRCVQVGVRPNGLGCTFAQCSAAGTCSSATTVCFNDYCVGAAPCNGVCVPGEACVVATNACSPAPRDGAGTCARSCGSGQLLVLHDPNNIFDVCDLSVERCDCATLPSF